MSGKYTPPYGETNWCGARGTIVRPPLHIFFKASCNKHDELYNRGGKEIDREMADRLFLFYMKQDIKRVCLYRRPFLLIWAYAYYFAVRLKWWNSFNYIKKK